MRRRSDRKKSSSPAPVPVARRSRRSRKVSENEKVEEEAPANQKDNANSGDVPEVPQAPVEVTEQRASSEERAGSGSSPVRKSRGVRATPKKRAEAKGGDKKVDTIPEEEPENGQVADKNSVEEERAVEPPSVQESVPEELAKEDQIEKTQPDPKDENAEKEDEKPQQDVHDDSSGKQSEPVQEVKVPSPSSKDEEHLKTSSDVLDIQTEEVEERDEEGSAPAERKESKKKHKEQKQELQAAEEEEQKENRKQQQEKPEKTQDEPADLPNDKHETSVNSSANNTASAPVLQQQRSVRKRRWLTNKKSSDRAPPVLAISTDSLKNIIADVVQPVPLSDVQLESSSEEEGLVTSDRDSERSGSPVPASEPRKDRDTEATTITTCETGAEATANKESAGTAGATGRTSPPPSTDTVPAQGGLSKATAATAAPHIVRSPSPARNRASHVLYITNLVRPFTVLQLKGLLARTGKIVEEDGFWIDRIKSKCFVAYSTEDEAIETRHALHGVRWPVSNPKCLNVDFGSRTDMDRAIQSTKDEAPRYGQENTRDNQQAGNAWSRLEPSDKKPVRPVREWDVGKKEPSDHDKPSNDRRRGSKDRLDSRSRDADRAGQDRKRSRDREGRGRERERDRNAHARSRSGSPVAKTKRKENEPPIRLLDDLFRKTKATPCIYWLPLTPEAIAEKEAFRQKRIEEHKQRVKEREERQKEREKDRDRQRETRRNRSNERRRSRSRERERRRY
ncbi:LOW QUALITY PROTEIN: apoptotic chromatin condensation inducer in the nucleus [Drosophila ficusphila]|uniref:LOW QUALITY PROTEIN: apoptotic chromatin condensation inducer in the nucleus n=1 Tax=Drosophila ficusphila TaxID=30025 RepID=UPI0007E8AC99|nr:LOW QUALITY PROTEIN: apoptotic chromatin condensation inducer in the nucleus [Drosophila ficusphila]